jgi:secreted PhoX family phosphatase
LKNHSWRRGLLGVGVLAVFTIVASLTPAHAEEPSYFSTGSSPQALWVADSSAFAEYSGKHLVVAFIQLGYTPSSMTFDSGGNFWGTYCTNIDGNPKLGFIFELTQPQIHDIEDGLTVTPKVEFQNPKSAALNFDCPSAIQFDQSGNLWVANKGADTKKPSIMKYTPDQLTSGGRPDPTFFTSPAIDTIWDMKFDGSGNLWLAADGVPQNSNEGIFEIKSNQLSAVGSQFVVTFNLELTSNALNLPTTLTFDHGGNLWTVGNGNTVLSFAADELGGSGTVSVNPTVTLSSSKRKNRNYTFFKPGGLAIDESGNLWVSSPKNGGGPQKQFGALCEFSSDGIATSGSPQCNLYAQGKSVTDHPAEITAGPQL